MTHHSISALEKQPSLSEQGSMATAMTHFERMTWSQQRSLQHQLKTTVKGIAVALTLAQSPLASAVDMIVNTTNPAINNGDGACSLIEAINNANTDSSAIHIDCPAGIGADTLILSTGTYTLDDPDIINNDNGLPLISSDISIQGNEAVIQRADSASAEFRIFEVTRDGHLTLDQTTISGGKKDLGGGILNRGTITMTNSNVSGNSAVDGGGIFNYGGTANITKSSINDNSASHRFSSGSDGGGIFSNGRGLLTLTQSTVSGNSANNGVGGGIYNSSPAIIHQTSINNNSAGRGGGIRSRIGKTTLTQSTVSGNSAINQGGGIYNESSTLNDSSAFTLIQTTVSDNSAANGGGINSNRLTLIHTTVSGNSASNDGGGILNRSRATIIHSTITGNSASNRGGGISHNAQHCCSSINNSIISGNNALTAGAEVEIFAGTVNTTGVNVFGHDGITSTQAFFNFIPQSSSYIIATSDGGTPTTLSSILNPVLADNDGATHTHALVAGSPAIDAISTANCINIPEAQLGFHQDQRGATRPVDGDNSGTAECDIGAFEFNSVVSETAPLDIDGNHTIDALTDGLLVIRYLFGLRSDSLIAGAIDADSTGITAADIEDRLILQEANNTLDIDGNEVSDALTDGLLVIRYLFGLRDSALIIGAIGNGATHNTAAAIEARIQALLEQ